ncbi:alpha/beta hydrolase [Chitinophaga vietnamensis]|uniref:alpha/beta hydrolase n=1 Tax=Chitinophaga vietnamensis TaxID=2593957 RepID=UPI001177CB67|nr:alpha/beta fold hydrolase [Chitinophaga vietnamensis]
MKQLKRAGYTLLSLVLLLNFIAAFHAWKFTHFYDDAHHINKRPEQMSVGEKMQIVLLGVRISKYVIRHQPEVPFETISLYTADSLRLEGWWIPVSQAKGTVILFHGYNGGKDGTLAEAAYFRQLGYNTFLLDFRASGNSEGHTCSIGYYEKEEVKLAYDYVQRRTPQPVILWGMSMGAAAVLHAVSSYGLQPQKVILECPYATLVDAVKSRMRSVHLPGTPLSQLLTFWGGLEQGFWGFSLKPALYARDMHMPVLYFWGKQDIRVMPHETQEIYANIASKDKTLYVLENAGHESFCKKAPEVWKPAVKQFMDK